MGSLAPVPGQLSPPSRLPKHATVRAPRGGCSRGHTFLNRFQAAHLPPEMQELSCSNTPHAVRRPAIFASGFPAIIWNALIPVAFPLIPFWPRTGYPHSRSIQSFWRRMILRRQCWNSSRNSGSEASAMYTVEPYLKSSTKGLALCFSITRGHPFLPVASLSKTPNSEVTDSKGRGSLFGGRCFKHRSGIKHQR